MVAQKLATRYQTKWVKEFTREYLKNKTIYANEDILLMTQEQKRRKTQETPSYLFCDTDTLVCKIWYKFKYGECHPWIEQEFKKDDYDLY